MRCVLVSHDRHLIRSLADDLWLVAEERVRVFNGDLDDYARVLLESRGAVMNAPRPGSTLAQQRRAQKRAEAEQRNRLSPLRAELRAVEEELDQLELERTRIEQALADPASYAAGARQALAEVLAKQQVVRSRLDELEARWVMLSEALQSAERAG